MIGGLPPKVEPEFTAIVLVPRERRIVIIERDGSHRIVGRSVTQPQDMLTAHDEEERMIHFSLIKCTRTSWIYREIVPPEVNHRFGDGSFNKNQR